MDSTHTYVAIMAGGVGSRFWPASRVSRPKQFLNISGSGKSLIRETFERFLSLVPASNIFIVTNGIYKALVKEHLPEISDNQILCEPSRNNTGPCVAYTAFKLHALDPDANFIIAPSDSLIKKEAVFLDAIREALRYAASHNALLTLGIQPTRPDTGYGYIHFDTNATEGVHKVRQFTEKPPLEKAKEFVASGEYLWNAGIFIWRAASILEAFKTYQPEIYEILSGGNAFYNGPEEQRFIDEHYPKTPSVSVDYAIMEHATNIYTLPADIGWSDLGTWASLHAESEKDNRQNVVQGGNMILEDTENCLLRTPEGKLVVIKGLKDFIVVDESDVLLIYPKSSEQEIKAITQQIEKESGDQFL
ncbi:MAG: mannose-1-phosphate guanylyltransferase [Saprospiraceae bacterium]|nr:mannose-1-phosphate guanylyltransferase [Saprospiraceae bacterium]